MNISSHSFFLKEKNNKSGEIKHLAALAITTSSHSTTDDSLVLPELGLSHVRYRPGNTRAKFLFSVKNEKSENRIPDTPGYQVLKSAMRKTKQVE